MDPLRPYGPLMDPLRPYGPLMDPLRPCGPSLHPQRGPDLRLPKIVPLCGDDAAARAVIGPLTKTAGPGQVQDWVQASAGTRTEPSGLTSTGRGGAREGRREVLLELDIELKCSLLYYGSNLYGLSHKASWTFRGQWNGFVEALGDKGDGDAERKTPHYIISQVDSDHIYYIYTVYIYI